MEESVASLRPGDMLVCNPSGAWLVTAVHERAFGTRVETVYVGGSKLENINHWWSGGINQRIFGDRHVTIYSITYRFGPDVTVIRKRKEQ